MTTSAHDSRRVWGGATRKPADTPRQHFSLYRELHPEMYRNTDQAAAVRRTARRKRRDVVLTQAMILLLDTGFTGTAKEFAERLDSSPSVIQRLLSSGDVAVRMIGKIKINYATARVWGK